MNHTLVRACREHFVSSTLMQEFSFHVRGWQPYLGNVPVPGGHRGVSYNLYFMLLYFSVRLLLYSGVTLWDF